MKKSSGRSWNYLASPECYEPDSAVSDELAPPAELAYDLGAWDRAMSMQKAGKHPLFLEQQLRHAFGLNDLKRMQDIFDALCQGRASAP